VVNVFTVVLDMLCNSNIPDLPVGRQVTEGSAGSLPPVTFLNGHNIRPTSCRPCGRFCIPAMEHPGSWGHAKNPL